MPQFQDIAIIGAGPAGLSAAEKLAAAGRRVTVYDRMATPARKFLRAGHGGLNLTHDGPLDLFLTPYGAAAQRLAPALHAFPPGALRSWCEGLGIETFVGTSGRVFPKTMKASPLLRAWRARLDQLGVIWHLRTRWIGWDETGALLFAREDGMRLTHRPDATLLALGGASWPQLGSDGAWTEILARENIAISPLRASNCGFAVDWSDLFKQRFAGQPIKPVGVQFETRAIQGELMITQNGIEGGPVYALSGALRAAIEKDGHAVLHLNLRHGVTQADISRAFSRPRGSQSLTNWLRKVGLSPIAIGLVQEYLHRGASQPQTVQEWAALVQAYPLRLCATGPIARAISSAGGIAWEEIGPDYQLRKKPGIFVAGEMLDWDAPTGGYLLQACFSTGIAAAAGLAAD